MAGSNRAPISRNATRRSRIAESIVSTFVGARATSAQVHWEATGLGLDEMYKGLWNVCCKEPYSELVRVSKRGELIFLRRV